MVISPKITHLNHNCVSFITFTHFFKNFFLGKSLTNFILILYLPTTFSCKPWQTEGIEKDEERVCGTPPEVFEFG